MQYTEVTFNFSFSESWQKDIFLQGLADMGYESFAEDKTYIPTHLFNRSAVLEYSAEHNQEVVQIRNCEDENWNAIWEEEHGLVKLPYNIIIRPNGAFGAGDHATTAMMLDSMAEEADNIRNKDVLDMGCGTGVLGIMAAKQGARKVVMVDIDARAVASAADNAELNNVTVTSIQGSTLPDGHFDYILANIHRNILLSLMPSFSAALNSNGQLLLSGFYESDISALYAAAESLGFKHINTRCADEWRMIQLQKTTNTTHQ